MRNDTAIRRRAWARAATAAALLFAAPTVIAQTPPAGTEPVEHVHPTPPPAQPDHSGHEEHAVPQSMPASGMMLENPLNKLVRLNELEKRSGSGDDVLAWDLDTWIGHHPTKLWLRSAGERRGSDTERATLEILWGKSFARWWDVVAGARADFAPGDDRHYAAIGVRGLAPYRFDVEATAYLRSGGQAALHVETAYEVLVTNKLVFTPSLEIDWYGRTDTARATGSGLAGATLGLRLRYELRREIAPYVGVVRERNFGSTADFARAAGADSDDSRLVAGIRVWF